MLSPPSRRVPPASTLHLSSGTTNVCKQLFACIQDIKESYTRLVYIRDAECEIKALWKGWRLKYGFAATALRLCVVHNTVS